MSCSMPTGGSRKRGGVDETPEEVKLGGRRVTRKARWRYIRGIKIRIPSRKSRGTRTTRKGKTIRSRAKKTYKK